MAPKKTVKMSLDEFMSNDDFGNAPTGSWADEEMPLPPASTFKDPTAGSWTANKRDFGGDRGFDGGFDRDFPSREPRIPVPIPDEPPFTARVGNLDYTATEDQVADLLKDFEYVSIRLPRDQTGRPRGVAFVEFKTREALEQALDLTDQDFLGRRLRVMVAEPPSGGNPDDVKFDADWRSARRGPLPPLEPQDDRNYDNWERRGPPAGGPGGPRRGPGGPPRQEIDDDRDYDNWERKGPLPNTRRGPPREGGRFGGRRDDAAGPGDNASTWRREGGDRPRQASSGERPKIVLTPRTTPRDDADTAAPVRSSNIFGSAKPIDTTKKLLEVEEKQQKADAERAEAAKKRRERFRQKEDDRKTKESEQEEQLRKRFDVLNTDDGDDESKDQDAAVQPDAERLEAKNADEATEAERLQTAEVSKEELETDDWNVVGKK